jgi:hypothetical protein
MGRMLAKIDTAWQEIVELINKLCKACRRKQYFKENMWPP